MDSGQSFGSRSSSIAFSVSVMYRTPRSEQRKSSVPEMHQTMCFRRSSR